MTKTFNETWVEKFGTDPADLNVLWESLVGIHDPEERAEGVREWCADALPEDAFSKEEIEFLVLVVAEVGI